MIPKPYRQMHQLYPEFMQAYEAFGEATRDVGPLSDREVALVKLAISLGAGLEGAAHSHCRKALQAGCSPDDLRHVALLTAPTIGFPTMMRGRSWVEDVVGTNEDPSHRAGGESAPNASDQPQAGGTTNASYRQTAGPQAALPGTAESPRSTHRQQHQQQQQ